MAYATRGANVPAPWASSTDTVAFNNVVVNASTAVNIGEATSAKLDHNLYFAQYIGTMADQIGRPQLLGWQSLSGQDAHSIQLAVTFRDAAAGDYACPALRRPRDRRTGNSRSSAATA